MVILKTISEGDEGEGVTLPMVVHLPVLQGEHDFEPGEYEY